MAWIESHQSLGRHPKLKAAARQLGVSRPAMVGHLQYLWWWALDFAEDGDLSGIDAEDIAEEALWDGDADEFIDALTTAGFLTTERRINDWDDYTGRLVSQRESNRERQRRHREKTKNQPQPVTSQPLNEGVTVTSPLRHGATVQNSTKPDHTEPKAKEPRKATYSEAFEAFNAAYPKGHIVKKTAYTEWQRIAPNDETTTAIMAGLDRWKACQRWSEGFVKSAHIWLRERWWENQPPDQIPRSVNGLTRIDGGRSAVGRDGRTDAERGYRLDPGPKGWSADELARMSMDDQFAERSGT